MGRPAIVRCVEVTPACQKVLELDVTALCRLMVDSPIAPDRNMPVKFEKPGPVLSPIVSMDPVIAARNTVRPLFQLCHLRPSSTLTVLMLYAN